MSEKNIDRFELRRAICQRCHFVFRSRVPADGNPEPYCGPCQETIDAMPRVYTDPVATTGESADSPFANHVANPAIDPTIDPTITPADPLTPTNRKVLLTFLGSLIVFPILWAIADLWIFGHLTSSATVSWSMALLGAHNPLAIAVIYFFLGAGISGLTVHFFNPMIDMSDWELMEEKDREIATLKTQIADLESTKTKTKTGLISSVDSRFPSGQEKDREYHREDDRSC